VTICRMNERSDEGVILGQRSIAVAHNRHVIYLYCNESHGECVARVEGLRLLAATIALFS
jgi:methionyl-tRNA formyltransferase